MEVKEIFDKIKNGELNVPVRIEDEVIKSLNQFTLERAAGLTDKNFNSWLFSLTGKYNYVALMKSLVLLLSFREDVIRKINVLLG